MLSLMKSLPWAVLCPLIYLVLSLSSLLCPPNPSTLCDSSRTHVIWSASKLFGSSGFESVCHESLFLLELSDDSVQGCTATQASGNSRNGLALAAHMNVSTLSTVFARELLMFSNLSSILSLNSDAYARSTSFLKRLRIHNLPCNADLFIMYVCALPYYV